MSAQGEHERKGRVTTKDVYPRTGQSQHSVSDGPHSQDWWDGWNAAVDHLDAQYLKQHPSVADMHATPARVSYWISRYRTTDRRGQRD
jgi:hypothetical protein